MTKVQENKEIPKYSQYISDLPMTTEESVAYAQNSYAATEKRLAEKVAELAPKVDVAYNKKAASQQITLAIIVFLLATTLPSCKVMEAAHTAVVNGRKTLTSGEDEYRYLYQMSKEEAASMAEDRRFEGGEKTVVNGLGRPRSKTLTIGRKKEVRND